MLQLLHCVAGQDLSGNQDPSGDIELALFHGPGQLFRGLGAHLLRVLLQGGEPGTEHLAQVDAVIAGDADILGDGKAHFFDLIHAADVGDIVRINDAGGSVF